MIEIAMAFLLCLDDSTEAEALYRRMEAKLLSAKTVLVRGRILYEGDLRGEPEVRLRIVKEENLLRYDRLREQGRWADDATVVSDGKRFHSLSGLSAIAVDIPDLGATSLVMFSRWGLERGVEWHPWHEDHGKAHRSPGLEEFRLLHREEVGPHKTVAISYVQLWGAARYKSLTTLWIDEETLLPVQRFQRQGGRCMHWTTTESYDEFRFDEAMPKERFRIPE